VLRAAEVVRSNLGPGLHNVRRPNFVLGIGRMGHMTHMSCDLELDLCSLRLTMHPMLGADSLTCSRGD